MRHLPENKEHYLDYPALHAGWPIATGLIEGACRHLIKDRMDVTGARWGLDSAEAVLRLRALRGNGDFDTYWPYHLAQERRRVHETRYLNGDIPYGRVITPGEPHPIDFGKATTTSWSCTETGVYIVTANANAVGQSGGWAAAARRRSAVSSTTSGVTTSTSS